MSLKLVYYFSGLKGERGDVGEFGEIGEHGEEGIYLYLLFAFGCKL